MLSAHYRSPLNFSADLMEASKNALDRIINAVENLKFLAGNGAEGEMTEAEQKEVEGLAEFEKKFDEAMDDDFNTADAIAAIFELVKYANSNVTAENTKAFINTVKEKIVSLADILGLIVEKEEEILDSDIEKLIEERQAARKEKNFARADEIRNLLLEKGIVLKDTREGVKWERA